MEDKDDLAVVEREELSRHKQSFDIRKAAAGLVDGARSAMAGAVATVQQVADGAMRAATPMVDDALAAIADAADGAAGAAADIGDAVNDWAYQQQLNRYRPVTKEVYQSPSFHLPNMIRIVDGNERRGIDVCRDAIGWLDTVKGTQIFNLYREAIGDSELSFYPKPSLYSTYYTDAFDRSRFVDLDSYFATMQQDKMAELRRIAFMLGAKRCKLEVTEYEETRRGHQVKGNAKAGKKGSARINGSLSDLTRNEKKILFTQEFEGDMVPQRPELHWYAHDSDILLLIETRCGGEDKNKAKSYRVELKSETTMTMSVSLAMAIDEACSKLNIRANSSLTSQAKRELRQSFVFEVEF
mgnify:FL=1